MLSNPSPPKYIIWHTILSNAPGRSLTHGVMRWIIANYSLLMGSSDSSADSTWEVFTQPSGEIHTCVLLARLLPISHAHLSTSGIAPALKVTLSIAATSGSLTHSLLCEEMMPYG